MPRFRSLLSLRFALALMIPMLVVAGVHDLREYRHARAEERAEVVRFGEVVLDANFDRITDALTVRNTPRPSSVLNDRVRADFNVSSLQLVDSRGKLQRKLAFDANGCRYDGPDSVSSHEHVILSRIARDALGGRIGDVRMVICLDDEKAAAAKGRAR